MEDMVIVAAARTAIGNFMGSLSTIPANVLGARVIRDLLRKTGIRPEQIDEALRGAELFDVQLKGGHTLVGDAEDFEKINPEGLGL